MHIQLEIILTHIDASLELKVSNEEFGLQTNLQHFVSNKEINNFEHYKHLKMFLKNLLKPVGEGHHNVQGREAKGKMKK